MTSDRYKPDWIAIARGGAWVCAWAALVGGGDLMTAKGDLATPGWFAAGLAVAGAGGAAWQLLNRRDLADRLTLISWLLALSVVLLAVWAAIPGNGPADNWEPGTFLALGGTVAGLVLAERYLRACERVAKEEASEPADRF